MHAGKVRGWIGRSAACALVAGALTVAVAASAGAAANTNPAVIGPIYTTLVFGAGLGLPEGCGLAVGTIILAAGEVPGASAELSPFLTDITGGCNKFALTGQAALAAGQGDLAPIAAWNPELNPVIADIAQGVQAFGTNYSDSLGPFGPTVAGLGNTINYFQGS
jgi:hypothetical protein